jgi:hypothetical protein
LGATATGEALIKEVQSAHSTVLPIIVHSHDHAGSTHHHLAPVDHHLKSLDGRDHTVFIAYIAVV